MQLLYTENAFSNYLQNANKSEFILNLSGCSVIECLDNKVEMKSRINPKYGKQLTQLKYHLERIEELSGCALMPNAITDVFYSFFVQKLLMEGMKPSSLKNLCLNLQALLKWSAKHGAVLSETYADFEVPDYHRPMIALTPSELARIYYFDLNTIPRRADYLHTTKRVKDHFCLSCNLGQRYSDMVRVTHESFKSNNNIFSIVQQKTGNKAVVNISEFAIDKKMTYEILQYYDFTSPYVGDISNYNHRVHELMKYVGIDDVINIETKINGTIKKESFRKYEMITSHTARRTFISNNVFRGIPEYKIRRCSGHTDSRSFNRYICMDEEE